MRKIQLENRLSIDLTCNWKERFVCNVFVINFSNFLFYFQGHSVRALDCASECDWERCNQKLVWY